MAPRMTTPRSTAPSSDAAPKGRDRFGLSSAGPQRTGFGAVGAVAGLVLISLAVGGIVWTAATGKAPPSQQPRIFGGSLVLDDYRPLTVIDLATGQVTVQLEGIYAQVGAMNYGDVEAVATSAGTTLVNRNSGTFNMLGKDDYVLGPSSNGISLGPLAGEVGAAGFSAGASTYILRYGPKSTVSLVDSATALAGAQALAGRSGRPVRPLGFIELPSRVTELPGSVTVDDGDIWLLASGANNDEQRKVPGRRADTYSPATPGPNGFPSRHIASALRRRRPRKFCGDARTGQPGPGRALRARPRRKEHQGPRDSSRLSLPPRRGSGRRTMVPGPVVFRLVGVRGFA